MTIAEVLRKTTSKTSIRETRNKKNNTWIRIFPLECFKASKGKKQLLLSIGKHNNLSQIKQRLSLKT